MQKLKKSCLNIIGDEIIQDNTMTIMCSLHLIKKSNKNNKDLLCLPDLNTTPQQLITCFVFSTLRPKIN